MKAQNCKRPALVVASFVILALGAGVATAMPPDPLGPSTVVRFHDLNLAVESDVATLYQRIVGAARWVCRNDSPMTDGAKMRHWRNCVEATTAKAIIDANRPGLTALHRKTLLVAGR